LIGQLSTAETNRIMGATAIEVYDLRD
jgi:hypothetical protein